MRGLALMFFPYPNLLAFQRTMQQRRHQCPMETLLGVRAVPSDTHMRDLLAGVPVALIRPLFPAFCEKIRRAGWAPALPTTLASGAAQGTSYTVRLDGSAYLHTTRLQCPSCVPRQDRTGEVHVRHTGVAGTLVKAGAHRVWPLAVAEGRNEEGHDTQDGESTAVKRFIPRVRHEHPQLALSLGGDAVYCHASCMLPLREQQRPHVLVCQPGSHAEGYREGEAQDARGAGELT